MVTNQKKTKTKLIALFALILITVCSVFTITASADNEVNFAIDVMFVIDGSGSMSSTDPGRVAMAACNLFTDMCDNDQARAGYVVYSSAIDDFYPLTDLSYGRQALKNAISSIYYPQQGATDHSLGLTKAKDLLIEGGALSEGRSPMIIFLSDGKTEISVNTPWRENVHEQELKETLAFLKDNGIPVYTIALNGPNAQADEEKMKDIANQTEALCFSTDSASTLSDILSQIMAHRLRSEVEQVTSFTATGQAQTVTVNIPNENIYQANIIIFSASGVKDIHLTEPGGNEVVVPSNNVEWNRSNSYDLIKLKRPSKGDWKLTLTGTYNEQIVINLLNSYDVQFKLKADKLTVGNGEAVTFEVYCASLVQGETDSDIFEGAEGTLTITNDATGDTKSIDFSQNANGLLSASNTFTKAGKYTVTGRVIGKDSSFDRMTDEIEIVVNPYPLKLVGSNETSGLCFSPFLGIKIKSSLNIPLADYISMDPDAVVTVTPVPGGWENICGFTYDQSTNTAKASAIGGGNAKIDLQIADSFGQSVSYTVRVKVIPGWILFAGALLLIAIIVAVVLIVKRAMTPVMKGRLKISVALPSEIADRTPPEEDIDLSILNKKGKVSLNTVIASNLALSGMYMQALDGIAGFISKIYLETANAEGTSLWIYIPGGENGMSAQFNNAPIDKKTKKSISSGMPAVLNYASFNGAYTISFNFTSESGGGGFDPLGGFGGNGGNGGFGGGNSGFGGGNSGFGGGGFGGGSNDGGFGGGGFGGGSNDSGFGGGGFGGGSNDSGFGGGNNDGGFGGFGNDNGSSFNAF